MNNIKIKLANEGDARSIARLGSTTFSETFDYLFTDKNDLRNYLDSTFSVEKIENSLREPNNIFWIAFLNQDPVGYAKLKLYSKSDFIESNNTCQLQKIYVLKDFLSFKIGSELQNTLLSKATELGFKKIWLSVLNTNDRAIEFYEKHGFYSIGDHNFQIGKEKFDFISMCKNLKAT